MTFNAIFRTSTSRTSTRNTCRSAPTICPRADETDLSSTSSPHEVIGQAINILGPLRTTRLTGLLTARAMVQVERHHFLDWGGIEELCLILPPPGLPFASLYALAVGRDDTLRLGRVGLPAGNLDAVRAQASSQSDKEIDGAQTLMQALIQAQGRRVITSLSACANVTLIPGAREAPQQSHQISMPTLDTLLSQAWVRAGNAWFDDLSEADLDSLQRDGLAPDRLRAAIAERMSARCAGVLNQLDYFDASVDNDPILSRWSLFLATTAGGDFVPSLAAYNYLVSRDPVVKASRVPVWADPEFMTHVDAYARYQRACETRLQPAQGRR